MPLDGQATDYLTIPADDVEAARVLREAADYIRENGWCQYTRLDPQGRVCANGAISQVALGNIYSGEPTTPKYSEAWRSVAEFVKADDCLRYGGLADWNNAFERTEEEVISVFENAASWLLAGRPGP